MMDSQKWISTLPNKNSNNEEGQYNIDPKVWTNTISQTTISQATISQTKTKNSIKRYSIAAIMFVVGLIFVSIIKNEARHLQKEIYNLQASINILKSDLHQEALDHEVITSPENISKLARENLNLDLNPYKKSQIKKLNEKKIFSNNIERTKSNNIEKTKFESLPKKIKIKVAKKIDKKRKELKKLQELYSKPKKLPSELKITVAKKIEKTKFDLKKLYTSPEEVITPERIRNWTGIQLVKLFFGIPIVPGR